MYRCGVCGNKKHVYEHNNIKTYVVLDEETGELIHTYDEFLECVEVVCDVCNANTEDKTIFNKEGEIHNPQGY